MDNTTENDLKYRDECVSTYKEFLSIPTIESAEFSQVSQATSTLSLCLSQLDYVNKKNRTFTTQTYVTNNGDTVITQPFITESTASTIVSISPSKSFTLQVKEPVKTNNSTNGNDNNEFIFDIIGDSRLIKSISVKNPHKKICNDEIFGKFSWSSCERYVAYIADSKDESKSFYEKVEPNEEDSNKKVIGDKYLYKDDWGEYYTPISNTAIFVLDIVNEKVIPMEPFPSDTLSAGQVIWTPDGKGLVFVAWMANTRKLGLKFCNNRIASLYYFNFDEYRLEIEESKTQKRKELKLVNLLPSNIVGSFRSPRFSPDGRQLVFIGFDQRIYTHNSCAKIFSMEWPSMSSEVTGPIQYDTLIDYVNFKDRTTTFSGVYCQGFIANPFINDHVLLFTSLSHSTQKVFSLNIKTKQIGTVFGYFDFTTEPNPLSYHLHDIDIKTKRFIVSASGLNQPSKLFVASVTNPNEVITTVTSENITFKEVYKTKLEKNLEKNLLNLEYQIFSVQADSKVSEQYPHVNSFQIMYFKRKEPKVPNEKKAPMLLFLHGGPHSCTTTDFLISNAYLCHLGYNIILVNYRGSNGFGKDFVECLPGRIGDIDVFDCLKSIDFVLELDPYGVDPNRIGVLGGSHGGFLSAHLSAYSQIKTAVMRNPVVDIASLVGCTDIPDWSYFESGVQAPPPTINHGDYYSLPSVENLIKMRNCSPIAQIDKIKIPTLLLIGSVDLRCPPQQGLMYYRSLKEKGVYCKCLMYQNGGHSLDNAEPKLDQWINVALWLNTHLYKLNK
eukprot:gene7941-9769_t